MTSPTKLLKDVCRKYGLNQSELSGLSRKSYLVKARVEFAILMREHGFNPSDTAVYLNRRHNNILHYLKHAEDK